MKKKCGIILMAAGAIALVLAAGLQISNLREDYKAEKESAKIITSLKKGMEEERQIEENEEEEAYIQIDGRNYIGYLSIPSIGCELPVLSNWNYENLRVAPCRFSGSIAMKNLVVAAHNYDHHFGRLALIEPGETVVFTDVKGNTSKFTSVETEELMPEEVDSMNDSGYELTMFTCTYSGQKRIAVRCRE